MSLKFIVKTTIASAWDLLGHLVSRPPQLTILYYHAVPDCAAAAFDAQMAYLKRRANIVDPDHFGPLARDRPNVAVTFDDAFQSVSRNALPILSRHGIRATIFAPTGWLGRPPGWAMETNGDRDEVVMSGEELAGLPRDLIAIGSHTVRHPRLTILDDAEAKAELVQSRAALETLLGTTVDTLAFPYGDYDARIIGLAAEAGYRQVYTVAPEAIRTGSIALSRGRTAVDPTDSTYVFGLKMRGGFDWMPQASRLKRALKARL